MINLHFLKISLLSVSIAASFPSLADGKKWGVYSEDNYSSYNTVEPKKTSRPNRPATPKPSTKSEGNKGGGFTLPSKQSAGANRTNSPAITDDIDWENLDDGGYEEVRKYHKSQANRKKEVAEVLQALEVMTTSLDNEIRSHEADVVKNNEAAMKSLVTPVRPTNGPVYRKTNWGWGGKEDGFDYEDYELKFDSQNQMQVMEANNFILKMTLDGWTMDLNRTVNSKSYSNTSLRTRPSVPSAVVVQQLRFSKLR